MQKIRPSWWEWTQGSVDGDTYGEGKYISNGAFVQLLDNGGYVFRK